MRRLLRLFAAACLVLAAGFAAGFAAPLAASASGGVRAQTGPCPGASAYPPVTKAMLGVSTTSPAVGERIEVSGQNYCGNEDVKIYLDGVYRATTHTDAAGSFDPPLVVHGPVGDQTLSGVGASGLSNDRDSLVLHVHATSAVEGQSIGGGGGLSSTGTDIAVIVGIAVALLGAGTALAYAGRRRRAA